MNDILEKSLLYDFYGELLSDHQKEVYEDVFFNDCSLSEVADIYGISRQGVHDLIKRCNNQLTKYEEKLGLVEKFIQIKDKAEEISKISNELSTDMNDKESLKTNIDSLKKLSQEIVERL